MARRINKVTSVASHRNGVSGAPFYAILFDAVGVGPMVATVFSEPGTLAVLALDKLAQADIAYGSNSWRGDEFEPELRQAIRAYEVNRALVMDTVIAQTRMGDR